MKFSPYLSLVNVLYNTDKDNITQADLQPGTYQLAVNSINSLINLLNTDMRFASWTVVAIGCADISPSNYKDEYNKICGNSCLAQDRAQGVADIVAPPICQRVDTAVRITDNQSIFAIDRSTNIAIIPTRRDQ